MPHIRERSHARPAEGHNQQTGAAGHPHPPHPFTSALSSAARAAGRVPARTWAASTAVALFVAAGASGAHGLSAAADITVVEDNSSRVVHTADGSVADVLRDTGVHLQPHDTVRPAPGARLTHGDTIRIVRAKDVTVVVDGAATERAIAATTVAEAAALVARADAKVTASRDHTRPLPASAPLTDGTTLTVSPLKVMFLRADGNFRAVVTHDPTIPGVLAKAAVTTDGDDIVTSNSTTQGPQLDSGATVTVVRVLKQRATTRTALAIPTKKVVDKRLSKGRTQVRAKGRAGSVTRTVETTFHDGKKFSTQVVATKTVKSAPKVVAVGAYVPPKVVKPKAVVKPKTAVKPRTSTTPSSRAASRNWAALARCESSGNPRAVSPGGTYRGLYQFDLSTWRSVGGTGDPINASAAEQTKRAQILYSQRGAAPWPVCGRYL